MTRSAKENRLMFLPTYIFVIAGIVILLVIFRICHAYKCVPRDVRKRTTEEDVIDEKENAHKQQVLDSMITISCVV